MRVALPPFATISPRGLARAIVAAAVAACGASLPASASPLMEPSPARVTAPPAAADVSFLIVTPARLSHEFERLARARRRDGITTEVVTLEVIRVAVPAARDDAERVREYLRTAHATRGLRWVLLGGDDGVVPLRRASLATIVGPIELPTDQYYACLDGDWNADGDDRWGEGATAGEPGDDVDRIPELGVGRAAVSTAADARDFVQRTLAVADRDPHPPAALLAADRLDIGPSGFDLARYAEQAAEQLTADGTWRVTRLYDNSVAWPGSLQETPAALVAALNEGPDLALILGLGRTGEISAGPDTGPYVTGAQLGELANAPRYTHVIAVSACVNQPGAADAIGASLLRARRGGAASVVGTVDLQFLGLGEAMVGRYLERLLAQPRPTFGDAMRDAIAAFALPGHDDFRLTTQGTMLLGDPTLRLPAAPPRATTPVASEGRGRIRETPERDVAPEWTTALPRDAASAGSRRVPGERPLTRAPERAVTPAIAAGASRALVVLGSSGSGAVRLRFTVGDARGGSTRLSILDLAGREVARLVDGDLAAGRSEVMWDAHDLHGRRVPAGLYFARLTRAGQATVQKLVVAR